MLIWHWFSSRHRGRESVRLAIDITIICTAPPRSTQCRKSSLPGGTPQACSPPIHAAAAAPHQPSCLTGPPTFAISLTTCSRRQPLVSPEPVPTGFAAWADCKAGLAWRQLWQDAMGIPSTRFTSGCNTGSLSLAQKQPLLPWLHTLPTFPQIARCGDLVGRQGTQHFAYSLLGSQSCRKHCQPFLALGGWIKPEESLADAKALSWQDSGTNIRASLNLSENKTPPHCHYSTHPPLRTKGSTKAQPNKSAHSQAWTQTAGGEFWMRCSRNDCRLVKMACFQVCLQVRKLWNACLLLENIQKTPLEG